MQKISKTLILLSKVLVIVTMTLLTASRRWMTSQSSTQTRMRSNISLSYRTNSWMAWQRHLLDSRRTPRIGHLPMQITSPVP
ncbi:hypothetical protein V8C42DRAFT_329847 [Trichoderma barbatum]